MSESRVLRFPMQAVPDSRRERAAELLRELAIRIRRGVPPTPMDAVLVDRAAALLEGDVD